MDRRAGPAYVFLFLAAWPALCFSQISLSSGCIENSNVHSSERGIDLTLTASSSRACEVRIPLESQPSAHETLRFEARSSYPTDRIQIGALKVGVPLSWQTYVFGFDSIQLEADGALLLRFQPKAIANLRTASTVWFSQLRVETPSAVPTPALAPAAAPATDTRSSVPAQDSQPNQLIWIFVLGFMAASVGMLVWARRNRRLQKQQELTPRVRVELQGLRPLFELNVRTWKSFRDDHGAIQMGRFDSITIEDLDTLRAQGFESVWFMGIWEIGAKAKLKSKEYGRDFMGSPFAIDDYVPSEELGGHDAFLGLVDRAHQAGLRVIIDFVPNHMGFDSRWLSEHPEFFIHQPLPDSEKNLSDNELLARYPGRFPFRTPNYPDGNRRRFKTIMVAYGSDPYFYPWIDTAQLDYAQPELRKKMIRILSYWAKHVDGVRCDMAMLVLRDKVKEHRHPEMSWDQFNTLMPKEFWTEAFDVVRAANPQFAFLAETYWGLEGALQTLGFDYTYNKSLYEALAHAVHTGHAEGFMNFIRVVGPDFLQRSVHFIENHDEERAMNVFGRDRQFPAAVVMATLPGLPLIHQGQREGLREKLPVHRVVPTQPTDIDTALAHFYDNLLRLTNQPVYKKGRIHPLSSNNASFISYARIYADERVLIIVNTSHEPKSGTVLLNTGIRLSSGQLYVLKDRFSTLKSVGEQPKARTYVYQAATLMNDGLYVELEPHSAHIFTFDTIDSSADVDDTLQRPTPSPKRAIFADIEEPSSL